MSGRLSYFKIGLIASLGGGAVFAALGLYLAARFLPSDHILKYHLIIPSSSFASMDPDEREQFYLSQEIQLLQAAQQAFTRSVPTPDFKTRMDRPEINISLRCSANSSVEAEFIALIQHYCQTSSAIQPIDAGGPECELTAGPSDETPETMWLDELQKKDRHLRDQMESIKKKYHQLNIETLSMEHQLATKDLFGSNPEFNESFSEQLKEKFEKDRTLIELERLVEELSSKIAALDLQAAQAQSNIQLDQLDQQREQVHLRMQHLRRQITKRQRWITEQFAESLWPTYEQKLKSKIAQHHQSLACYTADLTLLEQSIKRVTKTIEYAKVQIRQTQQHHSSIQSVSENSTAGAIDFNPDNFSKKNMLSFTQWLVAALCSLTGMGIGLLAGWAGTVLYRRTPTPQTDRIESLNGSDEIPGSSSLPVMSSALNQTMAQNPAAPPSSPALVTIDIHKDIPDQSENSAAGWTAEYDVLVEKIKQYQTAVSCPAVVLGAVTPKESSPRIAVNLAIALSRRQCRTLLVEADCTGSDLADIFDRPAGPGFFEWRRGEQWASHLIKKLSLPGLSFMASGAPTSLQIEDEIDLSHELHRWENLRRNYDVILLYSPSALAQSPTTPEQIAAGQVLDLADYLLVQAYSRHDLNQYDQWLNNTSKVHTAKYLGIIAVKS